MTFISLQFLIFFVLTTSLYFTIPHKFRWILLLLASCLFYMSFIPVYILVLFVLILIDFFAGILIVKSTGRRKKIFLFLSILSTITALFIFKYFNFFSLNLEKVALFIDWNYSAELLKIALPVGLSFHTFQSLAYVIEVYRGKQKPEKNIGIYALYVMFYPQLMAGPIERPYNMLHQFYERHIFDYSRVVSGLRLILWGAFQKVVIADRSASVVNLIYKTPASYEGLPLVIATVMFAFQIYCDFAGYSNMAIGAARVMGFTLMKNFKSPYLSVSIQDFWRRWHISLSTWFRDYLYIPLGGNRVSIFRQYINILVTFLLSGLWHGANWTFVIWGALHGVYMLIFTWIGILTNKLIKISGNSSINADSFIQRYITFCLVAFAWIFFRANSLQDAFYIINHMFIGLFQDISNLLQTDLYTIATLISQKQKVLGLTVFGWLTVIISIAIMLAVEKKQEKESLQLIINKKPLFLRWAIYYILVILIIFFASLGKEQFIYFQF